MIEFPHQLDMAFYAGKLHLRHNRRVTGLWVRERHVDLSGVTLVLSTANDPAIELRGDSEFEHRIQENAYTPVRAKCVQSYMNVFATYRAFYPGKDPRCPSKGVWDQNLQGLGDEFPDLSFGWYWTKRQKRPEGYSRPSKLRFTEENK